MQKISFTSAELVSKLTFLLSVCIIFAEDRLRLGQLKQALLHSTCTIFATEKENCIMKKKIDLSRDKIDFGKEKIGPLFRALFFPTLVGMIFMSLLH